MAGSAEMRSCALSTGILKTTRSQNGRGLKTGRAPYDAYMAGGEIVKPDFLRAQLR
ncbi:hypothetical protein [Roseibium sp.]|uniref:hypothetical protein n=1 Tax=Roseibium sp. TaxID=1936156 RepID=UPI003BAC84EC